METAIMKECIMPTLTSSLSGEAVQGKGEGNDSCKGEFLHDERVFFEEVRLRRALLKVI